MRTSKFNVRSCSSREHLGAGAGISGLATVLLSVGIAGLAVVSTVDAPQNTANTSRL